jgi:hypothetical protein
MTSTEFSIKPGTLILNQPIPDSVFGITVQEKTRISDLRRDDNDKVAFMANQTGRLDLPTVEKKSLDDIPWITSRGVVQYYPPPIEPASFSRTRISLMLTGIILIALGLFIHLRKRISKEL